MLLLVELLELLDLLEPLELLELWEPLLFELCEREELVLRVLGAGFVEIVYEAAVASVPDDDAAWDVPAPAGRVSVQPGWISEGSVRCPPPGSARSLLSA